MTSRIQANHVRNSTRPTLHGTEYTPLLASAWISASRLTPRVVGGWSMADAWLWHGWGMCISMYHGMLSMHTYTERVVGMAMELTCPLDTAPHHDRSNGFRMTAASTRLASRAYLAACGSMWQHVAACGSMWQHVAACYADPQPPATLSERHSTGAQSLCYFPLHWRRPCQGVAGLAGRT